MAGIKTILKNVTFDGEKEDAVKSKRDNVLFGHEVVKENVQRCNASNVFGYNSRFIIIIRRVVELSIFTHTHIPRRTAPAAGRAGGAGGEAAPAQRAAGPALRHRPRALLFFTESGLEKS